MELDTNPKYTLEIDPTNKYNFTDLQKMFIQYYLDFRNVNTAAQLCKIDQDVANQWFVSYSVQTELRRLNLALYQRQFAHKLLSIDEIGGYLSSLMTDENVPIADRLSTIEKLKVADMILKINDYKSNVMTNPDIIIETDINTQIKNLSVNAIKQLIEQNKYQTNNKDDIIEQLNVNNTFTDEEIAYLKTLPTNELLNMLNSLTNKEENKNE